MHNALHMVVMAAWKCSLRCARCAKFPGSLSGSTVHLVGCQWWDDFLLIHAICSMLTMTLFDGQAPSKTRQSNSRSTALSRSRWGESQAAHFSFNQGISTVMMFHMIPRYQCIPSATATATILRKDAGRRGPGMQFDKQGRKLLLASTSWIGQARGQAVHSTDRRLGSWI